MKCEIHGIEMEYAGETPYRDDIWVCERCEDEEDYYLFHNGAYQEDHPEEYSELWADLDDDLAEDWNE